MPKKKKKGQFGFFYSLSPNAGNVEYNNKVFNDMMLPGGGESSQGGEGQAMSEKLNETKEILYIIKDKNGRQLSTPSKDDSALWDRVEAMEARGRSGLSVVVYNADTLTDIADSIKVNSPKVPGAEAPINLLAINEANFADELRFKSYDAVATDDNTIKFTYVAQEPYEHEDAVDFVNEVERAIKALSKSKHYDKPFDVDINLSVRGEKDFDYKEKLHFNQKAEVMEENLKEEVGMKILKISLDDFDKHIGSRNTFGGINKDYDLIVRTEDGNVFFTGTPDNISKFISDYKVKEIPSARFISYMEKSLEEAIDKSDAHSSDDYKITSMEDMLDSMPGNADDETIDTTLKVFRKVSSYLGTHKKDIVVLVTDPATEYDPKNSGIKFEVEEIPHRFKKSSLHTYKTPDYEFIREQVYPANMVFLYFKNEGDKDRYLNDVYEAGAIQEDLSHKDYTTKADDIEFIMHDYVENDLSVSKLIQKDKLTYIVELEDGRKPEIKFDDQWDEWVYSIDGSDPISHSSYEYLISDLNRYAKEGLKEDAEAPFTYQLYDEEYIFDERTGNLRVLVDEVMPTTPGVLVNFIFLDHDESKKHPYRFIRKSRGRFPYEFEEVKEVEESLDEKLIQSDSDKALQKNIETEIEAGKDPKQAAAIAYSVQEKNKKKEESLKTYAGDPITSEEVNQGWEDLEKLIRDLKPGELVTLHNPLDPDGFEHRHIERRTDKPDYYRIYDEGPEGFANEIEHSTLENALYWAKKTYYSTLIDDEPAESFMDF